MTKRKFNPMKYIATCCKTEIVSRYPGEFVTCFCGHSYVDQTPYYTRVGGNAEPAAGEVERMKVEWESEHPGEVFGEDKDD